MSTERPTGLERIAAQLSRLQGDVDELRSWLNAIRLQDVDELRSRLNAIRDSHKSHRAELDEHGAHLVRIDKVLKTVVKY